MGATTSSQSKYGNDGNKGVLRIPQSSSITRNQPSDWYVLYPGHSLVGGLNPLQRSSRCILQPQPIMLSNKSNLPIQKAT